MNSIVWILLVASVGSASPPVIFGKYADEKACEATALQINERSKIRHKQRWFQTMDGICVPVDNATYTKS